MHSECTAKYRVPFVYKLLILKKTGMFGQIEFFSNLPNQASAKSTDFSNIFQICKTQFLELLKSHPRYSKDRVNKAFYYIDSIKVLALSKNFVKLETRLTFTRTCHNLASNALHVSISGSLFKYLMPTGSFGL